MKVRLLLGGTAALMLLVGGFWLISRRAHPPLPPLPDPPLADFPALTRSVVQESLKLVHANPEDADANGKLGMELLAHDRPQAAENGFRRAILLAPGEFRWRYYLGIAQVQSLDNDQAIVTLREAVRQNPDYLPVRLRLADCQFQMSRSQEALQTYTDILKQHPDSAQAHYGVGRIRATQGAWAVAVAEYVQSCAHAPKFAPAHYALSIAYRQTGKAKEAEAEAKAFEQNKAASDSLLLADEDPLLAEVTALKRGAGYYTSQASDLLKAGRKVEAVQMLAEALRYDPKSASAHTALVSLDRELGNLTEAETHYRAAVAIQPNQRDLHNNYGALLSLEGRHAEAVAEFKQELASNPNHAGAHNNLGDELVVQKRYAEALQQYRLAVKNGPDLRIARSNVASALIALKRYAEAIPELQKLLQIEDENTPTFLTNLSLAYVGLGKRREALDTITRAAVAAQQRNQTDLLRQRIEPMKQRLAAEER